MQCVSPPSEDGSRAGPRVSISMSNGPDRVADAVRSASSHCSPSWAPQRVMAVIAWPDEGDRDCDERGSHGRERTERCVEARHETRGNPHLRVEHRGAHVPGHEPRRNESSRQRAF